MVRDVFRRRAFRQRTRARRFVFTKPAALAAGVVSFVSSGVAGVTITATNATGGYTPYAYQWQRNANGGAYSNISNGGGVSGATTLTITDNSESVGVLYGYRLVYMDNLSNSVTSNAVTAQVYTGGAVSGGAASPIGSILIGISR